jgi:hypothetical protein
MSFTHAVVLFSEATLADAITNERSREDSAPGNASVLAPISAKDRRLFVLRLRLSPGLENRCTPERALYLTICLWAFGDV